ncbi:MAG: DUF4446 family protein [Actinobacteria bacterium]|nr:DUF4446 family protein [Actinomycetota bacterium]MCB9411511.1 DUF4446 family protein [Actinomycetota bacterium]
MIVAISLASVAVLALAVSVVALLGAFVALRRTARTARVQVPGKQADPVQTPAELRAGLGTALRHVSVIRYDAFRDVTGRQSFTAAILDDNGDGIVITSLHSRSESRTLLKGVTNGRAEGLSPEEKLAVAYATGEKEQPA